MFCVSLFLGVNGSYNFCGTTVCFEELSDYYSFYSAGKNCFTKSVGYCIDTVLSSRTFQILSMGYLQVFVHEMGHVLAAKILLNSKPSVSINTGKNGGGKTHSMPHCTAIDLAGPLASVVFACAKIFAAVALSSYITFPVALTIVIGSAIWIAGEFIYAATSVMSRDSGDFGCIAERGNKHLVASTAVLVGTCALGILAVVSIL